VLSTFLGTLLGHGVEKRVDISGIPEERACRSPYATCLADEVESLDNVGFRDGVRAAASVLESRGVGSGEVVAVILPDRVDLDIVEALTRNAIGRIDEPALRKRRQPVR
jgi:hypothetical protein